MEKIVKQGFLSRIAAPMNILIVLVVVGSFCLSPLPAKAAPAQAPASSCYELWSFTVTVSDGIGHSQNLVIGQGIQATDGTDPCDVSWPPAPPPGSFDARIKGSADDYVVDYRLANQPRTIDWDLDYVPATGGTITLTWNPADLPGAGTVTLVDVFTGGTAFSMDMSSGGSFDTSSNPFTVNSVRIRYVTTRCTISAVASGSWGSDATWNSNCSGGIPSTTDDAYIPDGFNVTFDAGSDTTVESLTLGGTGSLDFSSGNSLVVFDNAFVRGGTLNLGTLGNLFVNGEFLNAGTMYQTQNVGVSSDVNFLQITPFGGGADRYHGLDIATNSANNLGATTVRIIGNSPVCNNAPNGGLYRDRCFMANPANGGSATVTLYSTPSEDDITGDAFFQYDSGATWNQMAACNSGVGVGGNCSANVTFGSPEYFLIASGTSNPTAVELSSFGASNGMDAWMIILLAAAIVVLGGALVLKRLPER
jgi:hypothetical protein